MVRALEDRLKDNPVSRPCNVIGNVKLVSMLRMQMSDVEQMVIGDCLKYPLLHTKVLLVQGASPWGRTYLPKASRDLVAL